MYGTIPLFPTLIFRDCATLENYDPVQKEVKNCLLKIESDKDWAEVSWIHEEARILRDKRREEGSEHSYFIKDDLIGKYKLDKLRERIFSAVEKYVKSTQWGRIYSDPKFNDPNQGKYTIRLRNSWMNIQGKGKAHEWHCHPGYTIAGVYYMRVSADQGGIQFQNPNPIMQWCHFPEGPRSSQSLEFIPNDGDIILFPAWLMHNTMDNTTDEDRISVAFNIDLDVAPKMDDSGNGVQDFTKKSVEDLLEQKPFG